VAQLGRTTATAQLGTNLRQTRQTVLELAPLLAARDHDARGHMAHAHGGIGRVHALTTRAGRTKRVDLALRVDLVGREASIAGIVTICEHLVHASSLAKRTAPPAQRGFANGAEGLCLRKPKAQTEQRMVHLGSWRETRCTFWPLLCGLRCDTYGRVYLVLMKSYICAQ